MMAATRQPLQREHDRQSDWVMSKASARRVGYAVSIVVNMILLVLVQRLPTWGLPFLTPAIGTALWAFNLSLSATIVANALFFAYDAPWFRDLTQIALTALALLATVTLYRIFPFDFGDASANALARLALVAVNIALVVALFAQTIAWFVGLGRRGLGDADAGVEPVGDDSRLPDRR
jgi:hypothetical protein